MKKLTIFLVIALIGNICSAAYIDILVNEQAWTGGNVAPSDLITVLYGNATPYVYGGSFGAYNINVSNGEYVPDSGWLHSALSITPSMTATPMTEGGFDLYVTGGSLGVMPEEIVMSFVFHVPDYKVESDTIIIDPTTGFFPTTSNYAAVGGDDGHPYIVLHVTPEPTTIALLGIGALSLLRRRRKA